MTEYIDSHKLMYHPQRVSDWLDGKKIAPIYIEIGLTSACNHRCIFCALDYLPNEKHFIEQKTIIKLLRDMSNMGVKSVMFAGEGEPTLHPHFTEFVNMAKFYDIDVALTTNGVFYTPTKIRDTLDKLSWVKFSLDAGTKETYAKIHGCKESDFDNVLENIMYASELKEKKKLKTTIGVQMILLKENIDEVESAIKLCYFNGADYIVLKPYSHHPDSKNKHNLNLSKYDDDLKSLAQKYTESDFKVIYRDMTACDIESQIQFEKCYGLDFMCLIDAKGNVMPCNLYYDNKKFHYGNIKHSFKIIWNSKQRQIVINRLHQMGCQDCRKGCRLNHINKYLENVKSKNINDFNFI